VPGHGPPDVHSAIYTPAVRKIPSLPELHKNVHTIAAALLTFTRKPIYVDCTFHNRVEPSIAAQWTGSHAGGPGSRPRLCWPLSTLTTSFIKFACSFKLMLGTYVYSSSTRREPAAIVCTGSNSNSISWVFASHKMRIILFTCVTVASSFITSHQVRKA
jgi:hypothetical protein